MRVITPTESELEELRRAVDQIAAAQPLRLPTSGSGARHVLILDDSLDFPWQTHSGSDPVFADAGWLREAQERQQATARRYAEVEKRARQLFYEMLPNEAARYEQTGCIRIQSRLFPVDYEVGDGSVHVLIHGQIRGTICVRPRQDGELLPTADRVMQMAMMLKTREREVLKVGNWNAGGTKAWKYLCHEYGEPSGAKKRLTHSGNWFSRVAVAWKSLRL